MSTAIEVPSVHDAVDISASSFRMCVTNLAGEVICWGVDIDPMTTAPKRMPGFTNARAVSSGLGFICALDSSGTVYCAGQNYMGQLGDGQGGPESTTAVIGSATRVLLADKVAVQVVAGNNHACARLKDETVACWGSNASGALGLGDSTMQYATTPQTVPNIKGVRYLTVAIDCTCAVLEYGAVSCWGAGLCLGRGYTPENDSPSPVAIPNLVGVAKLRSFNSTICSLSSSGSVMCWGGASKFGLPMDDAGVETYSPVLLESLVWP